jgi:hypothetical protein
MKIEEIEVGHRLKWNSPLANGEPVTVAQVYRPTDGTNPTVDIVTADGQELWTSPDALSPVDVPADTGDNAPACEDLLNAASRIFNLRVDLLFGHTADYTNLPDGNVSSHFLIAVSLLEQAQHHMKLAARTLESEGAKNT